MRKIFLSTLFTVLVFCSFPLFSQVQLPMCSEEKNGWVHQSHFEENGFNYFVGAGTEQTIEKAKEFAVNNAFGEVSKTAGVAVISSVGIYGELIGNVDGQVVKDVSQIKGVPVNFKLAEKKDVSFCINEKSHDLYTVYAKIAVDNDEWERIKVQADDRTSWNINAEQCSAGQVENIKFIFYNIAEEKHWKPTDKQFPKPNFSERVPQTAYFAEIKAECNDGIISMRVMRYNLVNGEVNTIPNIKGHDINDLQSDLYKSWLKMRDDLLSNLGEGEKEDTQIFGKTFNIPHFDTESDTLVEKISEHIDSYGVQHGSMWVDSLFDQAMDKKSKDNVRVKVFNSTTNAKLWEDACKQGNPEKCYLLSMRNDDKSAERKKFACDNKVEKACFDLYVASKNRKKWKDALNYAEQSCHLGNLDACFFAAKISWKNSKVKKTIELLEYSCNDGYAPSCSELGEIYSPNGTRKVKSDKVKSKMYFDKSCNYGRKKDCKRK